MALLVSGAWAGSVSAGLGRDRLQLVPTPWGRALLWAADGGCGVGPRSHSRRETPPFLLSVSVSLQSPLLATRHLAQRPGVTASLPASQGRRFGAETIT